MIWVLCTALLAGSLYFAEAKPHRGTRSLAFLVVGDFGGQGTAPYYTTAEKKVASAMGEIATRIGSQFTIGLGDNIYPSGVRNVTDPRFQTTFENVFTARSLQSRWYMVCGNHDHYGNASAQVEYTKVSKRWYMPDLYYTKTIIIPGTTRTVQFIFIDTIILCDPKVEVSQATKQWAWITKTLQRSKADWIIMAGHYPVWSASRHGPTPLLLEKLEPLLEEYGVNAYFAGHEHDLQHIKADDADVNYFVSGAGHSIDNSSKHVSDVPEDSLKYHYDPNDPLQSLGGYASVSITPQRMRVTFYDESAIKLYSVLIQPIERMKKQKKRLLVT